MANGERDLPKLTAEQVHAHERFAWMEITMKERFNVPVACCERPSNLAQSSISFSSASFS
jgi:hypothetical protein